MKITTTLAGAALCALVSCSTESSPKTTYGATPGTEKAMQDAKDVAQGLQKDAGKLSSELQQQADAARAEIQRKTEEAAAAIGESNADEELERLKRELGDG